MKTITLCILFFCASLATAQLAEPDLIVTDIWNDGAVIWYQIRNVGESEITTSFVNKLYVDGSFQATDYITVNVPAGKRVTRYFDKYNWQCSSGADQIMVVADADDDIVEVKETNNTRTEVWPCDTTAPTITSGPNVSASKSTATVTWTTERSQRQYSIVQRITGCF